MSWLKDLYDTYQNNLEHVTLSGADEGVPLLPIAHSTQKAQIEIVISTEGTFLRAYTVPKDASRTIIPCTESSAGRTSGPIPHPLADKLQYVAKDYSRFGGRKKPMFDAYIAQLSEWCDSKFSHPSAIAILKYTEKGTLISDLVNAKLIPVGEDGKITSDKSATVAESSFEVLKLIGDPSEAFVRWLVQDQTNPPVETWLDPTLWNSWINFLDSTKEQREFCFVLGTQAIMPDQHPYKIRNDGDKAKLISSNDLSDFTFRGRFIDKDEAASVSMEVTQKAHAALRWLISRQGYRRGDLAIVAWAIDGSPVPPIIADTPTFLEGLIQEKQITGDTAQETGIALRKAIAGYRSKLGDTANIITMGFDSATPGRLSIIYYRRLKGSELLEKLESWHTSCAWVHRYISKEVEDELTGKKKKITVPFTGAPSPADIAEAAYGQKVDDNLRKHTIERILPCILEGQPLPGDLMLNSVRRASNRSGKEKWEWEKTLTIACALFNKYNRKEKYKMSLDTERKTRDYLYGRLLAVAENIESWALSSSGDKRETNASRLMQRFADHPFTTWRTIELALVPYKNRIQAGGYARQKLIDEIINSFDKEDFISDKPLSGEFLLGYHNQRSEFYKSQEDQPIEQEELLPEGEL